jgi:hypothetical protein
VKWAFVLHLRKASKCRSKSTPHDCSLALLSALRRNLTSPRLNYSGVDADAERKGQHRDN